jgi:hypothetical protein
MQMSVPSRSFRPNRLLPLASPELDKAAVQLLRAVWRVLLAPGRAMAWLDKKLEDRTRREDEAFLCEAVDVYDLEWRMRELDRRRASRL